LKLDKLTDESHGTETPPIAGDISFRNVTFAYPERPDATVLRNVSLVIKEHECVAVVGKSGSGKSTIAALLQRLYEPKAGSVSIGKHDVTEIDAKYLRDHVAVVSQQAFLFDATVAENIAYGAESVSDDDIQAAARAANVHDVIMSLPNGYQTVIGENASLISGGQAQRIQIARALVRPSRILILDECTSALDAVNEAAVMETIKHASVGRTTIMITHKLQLMQACDRVIVVQDGEIVEEGTYQELTQNKRQSALSQLASGGVWQD
jgi:ATP-binding cassette, subfamily B (MDR/TAP), member 1